MLEMFPIPDTVLFLLFLLSFSLFSLCSFLEIWRTGTGKICPPPSENASEDHGHICRELTLMEVSSVVLEVGASVVTGLSVPCNIHTFIQNTNPS